MAKRRSKEEWLQLVEEFKASDLNFSNWCKEKNISKSSIYPYVKAYENNEVPKVQTWGRVSIPKNSDTSISLKVGNITLDIKPGFNKETLTDILNVVTKVC